MSFRKPRAVLRRCSRRPILATARLGLRISDLRHLEPDDLDWRAKTITIVQHKTGRPLSLPSLEDVGWVIID